MILAFFQLACVLCLRRGIGIISALHFPKMSPFFVKWAHLAFWILYGIVELESWCEIALVCQFPSAFDRVLSINWQFSSKMFKLAIKQLPFKRFNSPLICLQSIHTRQLRLKQMNAMTNQVIFSRMMATRQAHHDNDDEVRIELIPRTLFQFNQTTSPWVSCTLLRSILIKTTFSPDLHPV